MTLRHAAKMLCLYALMVLAASASGQPTDSDGNGQQAFKSPETRALRELMVEMDRRYSQRFADQDKAVSAALQAQKDQTAAALVAAEKAVAKAEAAQSDKNATMNEFRGQLSDQAATFMPRKESEQAIDALRDMLEQFRVDTGKQIADLRESRSAGEALAEKGRWNVGIAIGVGSLLIALAVALVRWRGNESRRESSRRDEDNS